MHRGKNKKVEVVVVETDKNDTFDRLPNVYDNVIEQKLKEKHINKSENILIINEIVKFYK